MIVTRRAELICFLSGSRKTPRPVNCDMLWRLFETLKPSLLAFPHLYVAYDEWRDQTRRIPFFNCE